MNVFVCVGGCVYIHTDTHLQEQVIDLINTLYILIIVIKNDSYENWQYGKLLWIKPK